MSPHNANPELRRLGELSARLGSDPLLVQAATGNTSIKIGNVLWIKASGKWLAHASHEDIFVPLNLAETRARIRQNCNPACAATGASVETAMHAVIPHRVILHVHSVNAIAWAVNSDAAIGERLNGLEWRWVPYKASGLELACEIAKTPEADVFVLANHGLVVCGSDCEAAESRLREVESRMALEARETPEPDWTRLEECARGGNWRLPDEPGIHALGTDPATRKILAGGVLYPCQAIFLSAEDYRVVDGAGVMIRDGASVTVNATLSGLAKVLRRIGDPAQVRYLSGAEVESLLSADVYRYRKLVESSGPFLQMALGMD